MWIFLICFNPPLVIFKFSSYCSFHLHNFYLVIFKVSISLFLYSIFECTNQVLPENQNHIYAESCLLILYIPAAAPAAAKSLQSCPTLCNPTDGSPPGSPVPGVLQARTLEWVAISFSNAWKWKVKVKSLSRVRLLATPWTAAHQAPPSMGFSRQECWSGLPLPSPLYIPTYAYIFIQKSIQYSYHHIFSYVKDFIPETSVQFSWIFMFSGDCGAIQSLD